MISIQTAICSAVDEFWVSPIFVRRKTYVEFATTQILNEVLDRASTNVIGRKFSMIEELGAYALP